MKCHVCSRLSASKITFHNVNYNLLCSFIWIFCFLICSQNTFYSGKSRQKPPKCSGVLLASIFFILLWVMLRCLTWEPRLPRPPKRTRFCSVFAIMEKQYVPNQAPVIGAALSSPILNWWAIGPGWFLTQSLFPSSGFVSCWNDFQAYFSCLDAADSPTPRFLPVKQDSAFSNGVSSFLLHHFTLNLPNLLCSHRNFFFGKVSMCGRTILHMILQWLPSLNQVEKSPLLSSSMHLEIKLARPRIPWRPRAGCHTSRFKLPAEKACPMFKVSINFPSGWSDLPRPGVFSIFHVLLVPPKHSCGARGFVIQPSRLLQVETPPTCLRIYIFQQYSPMLSFQWAVSKHITFASSLFMDQFQTKTTPAEQPLLLWQ